jgi:branched-subunit amino acid permease
VIRDAFGRILAPVAIMMIVIVTAAFCIVERACAPRRDARRQR